MKLIGTMLFKSYEVPFLQHLFLVCRHTRMPPQTFQDLCSLNRRRRRGETKGPRKEGTNLPPVTKRGRRRETRSN